MFVRLCPIDKIAHQAEPLLTPPQPPPSPPPPPRTIPNHIERSTRVSTADTYDTSGLRQLSASRLSSIRPSNDIAHHRADHRFFFVFFSPSNDPYLKWLTCTPQRVPVSDTHTPPTVLHQFSAIQASWVRPMQSNTRPNLSAP